MSKAKKTAPVAAAAAEKVKGKKITKADIVKSGLSHGMVLVNPNTGDQEIHGISNARDLTTLSNWRVITEFGSTKAIRMTDVLANLKNIPASNDGD